MKFSRRSLLSSGAVLVPVAGLGPTVAAAQAFRPAPVTAFRGYGELVKDPKGFLDLPRGFQYRILSAENEPMKTGGVVPSAHDGMAAFAGTNAQVALVRNHEINLDDVEEDGATPVPHVAGATYDTEVVAGGTTTLLVAPDRRLIRDSVSLAGTVTNCAGGPSPWGTWLTCEEEFETIGKPHGYVFEVDPFLGGNPLPILGMGRFEHEAVAFGRHGVAYLTEDADSPFGCVYRYIPARPLGGRGSLHAGGKLAALAVPRLGSDLSIVQNVGMVLNVAWIDVPNPNPGDDDTPVREQVQALGATQIQKAEGIWSGKNGTIWFVCSYGGGPDAEDEEDRSAAAHSGQIWKYDPTTETIELVALFPVGSEFDGPDNITVGPHGFAVACTDGEDSQWLVGVTDDGRVFPFGFNALNDNELAGATFSPDGRTLFANLQGPGLTYAIWGPWAGNRQD
ncbi:MAG TPA: alkaline phosphatase PhoX [Gammaproteobacteria bacterium]